MCCYSKKQYCNFSFAFVLVVVQSMVLIIIVSYTPYTPKLSTSAGIQNVIQNISKELHNGKISVFNES